MNRARSAILAAGLTALGAMPALVQAASGEPVTIGVSGPLTGQNAQYGAQWKKGFDLALDEVNAKGGVKGRPLQYVFEDSQADPRQTVAIAQKFVSDPKIVVELGDFSSTASMAASPIYQRAGLVQFGFTNSHPNFTKGGDFIWSNSVSQADEQPRLAKYAADLGFKRVAVLYLNTDWGRQSQKIFSEAVKAAGLDVVASEAYQPDEAAEVLSSFIDYTVNGLVIGNIYALLAVGLALIFGVANLINFAHGSVYTIGAYVGWAAITFLHTPLPLTMAIVFVVCALLGIAIERVALRPLQGKARIAPLLATIGLSFVLDQLVQLICSPDPRAVPSDLPDWRLAVGGVSIGPMDLLIAAVGIVSAALLYAFLRFTKLGFAVRATAQDRDAALQMGVNVNAVNSAVFAIASALGGLGGLLVGMYYNHIDPAMSFQATLKGVVAQVIGGVGNVPGAILGGALLGLTESYGIAAFGTTYRNLFAFVLLIVFLIWFPNGLFGARSAVHTEPLVGTFIAPSRPIRLPRWLVAGVTAAALALPFVTSAPYLLQTLTNAWLAAVLALSLTLVAGTAGQISLGQAALLAIGGYASALLALDIGAPAIVSVPAAGLITATLGALLVFPAFRLRGHYIAIATLAIGEIVSLVILNWEGLTGGAMGLTGIPPLSFLGRDLDSNRAIYWTCLLVLIAIAALQTRLLGSHLGRTLRAVREDEIAARSYGVSLDRYKALAFAFGGFAAGVAGAITAHLYSYLNNQTFDSQLSLLALTMVMLGGMGNVLGAIVGAVVLVGLPELFRVAAEYRILIYGVVLLLLVRFRPQGLLGTV